MEFDRHGLGEFGFIAVQGALDCRYGQRDGMPLVEFTWEGVDEGGDCRGRGWATLRGGRLEGRWHFHHGDDSGFVATRPTPSRS